jgi:hypothetical protein
MGIFLGLKTNRLKCLVYFPLTDYRDDGRAMMQEADLRSPGAGATRERK